MEKVFYYGVEGVTMIWHGSNADAEVEYNGYVVNEPSVSDYMWDLYKEDYPNEKHNDESFFQYMRNNGESMKEYIRELWFADHDMDMLVLDRDEEILYIPKDENDSDLIGFWKSAKPQFARNPFDGDVVIEMYDAENELRSNEGYADDIWYKLGDGKYFVNDFSDESPISVKEVENFIKK